MVLFMTGLVRMRMLMFVLVAIFMRMGVRMRMDPPDKRFFRR